MERLLYKKQLKDDKKKKEIKNWKQKQTEAHNGKLLQSNFMSKTQRRINTHQFLFHLEIVIYKVQHKRKKENNEER